MFDAWTIAGVGGGSAALTYLAAGWRQTANGDKKTLRLSIDKSNSLLGDVRLWGGAATAIASYWVKGANTKKTLNTITAASWLSLVQTEIVRWRLLKAGDTKIAGDLPLLPQWNNPKFGAIPGPNAQANQRQWARR